MTSKIIKKYNDLSVSIKATVWFTLSNILQKGVLFLAVPIYTRLLTTEQYGMYSIFISWLEIFEIIATFRIAWGGYVVGLNKYEDRRDSYTSSMNMLSLVITAFFLGVYVLFRNPINSLTELPTSYTLVIFGILFAMPAIQFWTVRERVELRYRNVFAVSAISSILVVAFGSLFAVLSTEKVMAVIVARLVIQGAIAVVLIYLSCRKNFTFFDKEFWVRALKFNVPLLPYYLSMVVLHSADKIIIGNLVGKAATAIYGVAYTLSSCMQLFSSSINQTLQPWLYKQMKENKVEKVADIISFSMIVVVVLNLLLIALAPEVITIVAPDEYKDAVWVIPPLAASVVVMYFYQHFVNVEFYFEESRLTAIASIGAAILNVILNYIFIPVFGYVAAGYTTLASYLVFAFFHYLFMRIICRKNNYKEKLVDMKSLLLILGVFFVCTAALMVGYNHVVIRYAIILIICIIVFLFRKKVMSYIDMLLKSKKKKSVGEVNG